MLRKNALAGILFLVFFMPTALWGQEMMHGKWWNDKSMIRGLELSNSERKELDSKYNQSRRKMIDLKSEMEKHRFELELLLGAKEMNKQKIMERYDSLEETRHKLSKERFEMLMGVRETIGAERFQELEAMHRARGRENSYKKYRKEKPHPRNRDND